MSLNVVEEIIVRQPPEAQAIIRALLAEIAELKARIEELERQAKGKTPQNSSLPPSTQHPHARPQPPKRKSKKKRGGQPGHEKHERPLIPTNECARRATAQTDRMPTMWCEALGQRPGAAAASGVGIARDQTAGDRIPTPSVDVSLLRRDDVCGTARRRAAGAIRSAIDGADGAC